MEKNPGAPVSEDVEEHREAGQAAAAHWLCVPAEPLLFVDKDIHYSMICSNDKRVHQQENGYISDGILTEWGKCSRKNVPFPVLLFPRSGTSPRVNTPSLSRHLRIHSF